MAKTFVEWPLMYATITQEVNENGPIHLMKNQQRIVWLARQETENRLILIIAPVGTDVKSIAIERLGEDIKLINGGDSDLFTITPYPLWWKLPEDRIYID
jgi:hypothetical protein